MRNISIIILLVAVLCFQCQQQKDHPAPAKKEAAQTQPKQQDTTKQNEPTQKQDTITTRVEQEDPLPVSSKSEESATSKLWEKYRKFREDSKKAFNNSKFQEAITNLKLAAKYARQLDREDLVAWQYNNIAYYSILEFKGLTNYDYRLHQLRSIKDPDRKEKYIEETKDIFRKNLKILTDAEEFLEKAYKIDENYKDQNRTDKIYSNLKFIDWVKNFTKN